jgi:hypothetical protein
MKENQTMPPAEKNKINLGIISDETLSHIVQGMDMLLERVKLRNVSNLDEYMTEKEAIGILKKRATWFWQRRKSGELLYKKIGHTVYYSRKDIDSLLKN